MVVVVCHSPRPIIKLGQFQVGHKLALQFTLWRARDLDRFKRV